MFSFSEAFSSSSPLTGLVDNPFIIGLTWILFEVSFPVAFIVSSVVTFVLIPTAKKNNLPVHHFFLVPALLMHNANVAFMVFEIIANRLHFVLLHFPFTLLYGMAYSLFSWYLYQHRGVFYYSFLDYGRKGALYWYIGLIGGMGVFFLLGYAMSVWITQNAANPLPYAVRKQYFIHVSHLVILLL